MTFFLVVLAALFLLLWGSALLRIKRVEQAAAQAQATAVEQAAAAATRERSLQHEVDALNRYRSIQDAELAAEQVRLEAARTADQARKEAARIADQALADAQQVRAEATRAAEHILNDAKQDAFRLRTEAQQELSHAKAYAGNTRVQAVEKARLAQNQADAVLAQATQKAARIVESANRRAEEIAGEALHAARNAAGLEKTIQALKNVITGYGDQYLIPSHSLLDELAEQFSHTEAGTELKQARERTRYLVGQKLAAQCDYVEAVRSITAINFITDAFNGKVDTVLANVKHDNYGTLAQQIKDAFALVNHLGKPFRDARITPEYLEARLLELRWAAVVHELKMKEREEQRLIKEQIREEEKARRDFERAQREAAKQEETIQKSIEKVQQQAAKASDEQRAAFEAQLRELEARLQTAQEKNQRALSMAQQTKSGHVYVISNLGSFGEHVYKIGMTRRLEPLDRVRELGDASVPFEFDVHALLFSDDAPTLERELHRRFLRHQLNKANPRKEFFRVNLTQIRDEIEQLGIQAHWALTAEAREYRESLAIEQALANHTLDAREWEQHQLAVAATELDIEEIEA